MTRRTVMLMLAGAALSLLSRSPQAMETLFIAAAGVCWLSALVLMFRTVQQHTVHPDCNFHSGSNARRLECPEQQSPK